MSFAKYYKRSQKGKNNKARLGMGKPFKSKSHAKKVRKQHKNA